MSLFRRLIAVAFAVMLVAGSFSSATAANYYAGPPPARGSSAPMPDRDRDRAGDEEAPPQGRQPKPEDSLPSHNGIREYIMGAGDKVKITVFGEEDLSGQFEVSSTGEVSMPLIGPVKAAGNTVSALENAIAGKLKEGYMKDPRVSVEVNSYRPFFIVGEVMKPGSYDYVNGMSVITAVALAGGYTYRADKDGITVKHGGRDGREAPAKEDTSLAPGDVIRVPERFF
jgi:polysaccharide export outer membrane protein